MGDLAKLAKNSESDKNGSNFDVCEKLCKVSNV